MHHWHTFASPELAAQAAADFMENIIQQTLQHNAVCHVALPGGNTPAMCFNYLAQKKINWPQVHWYLGDERCLPVNHAERNDVMIRKHLWSRIQATPQSMHTIPAELGAAIAAQKYATEMNGITLDIALLGMGEDGHTASLFPGNVALDNQHRVVAVFNAPKPPAERVSLGITTLRQAKHRIVLTTGASKKTALTNINKQADLPVNRIGDIEWFIDATADNG